MANALTKDLEIMFENFVEGFDAACVLSTEVKMFKPDQQSMQRAGDVVYRPQDYYMNVVAGVDISASSPTDLIQRQVPSVYKSPQNIRYDLDAKEMRDMDHMKDAGEAAGKRLSAQIDSDMAIAIRDKGANVIKRVGVLNWDTVALAEATMLAKGAPMGVDRKLIINPFDYKDIAGELGSRAYFQGKTEAAYERTRLPDAAGFKTFRADILPTLTATGTVSGTTVNGAQSYTPTAMTGDIPTDNRQMTLTVAGANVANIKVGDSFTIAGVNSVHNVTKDDTGQLQSFRVLAVAGGGVTLTISPAIISSGAYQNVSAQAANGAALTFLNTASKSVNPFWCGGAVELMVGRLAFPTDQGVKVATATSKQGVPLIMSYAFDHLKGKTTVRFTSLYGTTVLEPELAGIILANQT